MGQFMFIDIYAATRHWVSYFAINARFVDENKKTISQALGVKEYTLLFDEHTSGSDKTTVHSTYLSQCMILSHVALC